MYSLPLIALGLGHLAYAQNSTVPNPGPTPPPNPDAPGFPAQLGDYQYYGCARSDNGFVTFSLADSGDFMSLNSCAETCEVQGSRFFGVYDEDCYCGEDIDIQETTVLDNEFCDIVCPGNSDELCGGLLLQGSSRARRQAISASVLLSLYIRVSGGDDDVTVTVTDAPATLTNTVTSTVTDTVTTCPPGVDCPLGPTTRVTTITATYCPAPTEVPCYGDCPYECLGEACYCPYDICFPVPVCEGTYCPPYLPCKGPGCPVPQPPPCHGEHCAPCHGPNCPIPFPHPVPAPPHHNKFPVPPACEGPHCDVPVVPVVPACVGPDCEGPTPITPECEGAHCPPVTTPVVPCEGPHCPAQAAAGKTLPAMALGAIAGLAFIL